MNDTLARKRHSLLDVTLELNHKTYFFGINFIHQYNYSEFVLITKHLAELYLIIIIMMMMMMVLITIKIITTSTTTIIFTVLNTFLRVIYQYWINFMRKQLSD